VAGPDSLEVLRAIVEAHNKPSSRTGGREPLRWFVRMGRSTLQHHGFTVAPPDVDEALLEELHDQGLLSIEYREHHWNITPTPGGRAVVEQRERVGDLEPRADVEPLLAAVAAQAEADNKLGWPAVRPVLLEIRRYWEAAGLSPHGVQVPALVTTVPDDRQAMFSATLRQLINEDYLRSTTELSAFDLPVEVEITGRTHAALDGWPGAAPSELVDNFLAVIAEEEAAETDPVRQKRLRSLAQTVRDVGVSTAGEVLAKVLTGAS
jgi:hypothetical protein